MKKYHAAMLTAFRSSRYRHLRDYGAFPNVTGYALEGVEDAVDSAEFSDQLVKFRTVFCHGMGEEIHVRDFPPAVLAHDHFDFERSR